MQEKRPLGAFLLCGRGDRIRTYDPLVPNQMRYQTALHPDDIYSTHTKCLLWTSLEICILLHIMVSNNMHICLIVPLLSPVL